MSGPHGPRIARAIEMTEEAGLDGLIVTPGSDLVYLTGYAPLPLERLTMLVLSRARDPVMLVPTLERPAASASPVGNLVEIVGWSDGEDPYAAAASLTGEGRFAVTDQAWAVHVLGLQGASGGVRLVPSGAALSNLRAVKDDDELAHLSAAARAADAAFAEILGAGFAGRREEQIAADLAAGLRAQGHESVDFTIVGSGPNGASPHHEAGERVIEPGDVVVLDFGGRADGYCSDITRTVTVGEPADAEFRRVYEVVRAAQQAAFEAVVPGAQAQEIDAVARGVIDEAGYGGFFVHRTGHGIGLETHEPPYIVRGNDAPLEPGMTFSIEPGIYLPERFGVRIEDIVAVTGSGCVRLNEATREVQVVS